MGIQCLGKYNFKYKIIMKNIKSKIWVYLLSILGVLLIFAIGCKKNETVTVPVLSTSVVSAITSTTATGGGNITSDGGAEITERGVCWSTTQNPTIDNSIASNGSIGTGSFTTNISGLTGNTTYYVRAYATNSAGTGYGEVKTFTTSAISDFATTLQATDVKSSIATFNGIVNANYLSTNVTFEYGTSLNYGNEIDATPNLVTGNSNTNVSASLTGLSATTTYHYRVKIVNSSGTAYGADMTFITNYIVGETAYGGVVFYRDSTGQHGLVCAPTNQSTGATWGCDGTAVGGTSTIINTGAPNTNAIIVGCTTAGIAAKLCYDLALNGYSDWYLPSKDELGLMYSNLHLQGMGGFAYAHYWSSSEIDATNAWKLLFGSPMEMDMGSSSKSCTYYVRAVRAY